MNSTYLAIESNIAIHKRESEFWLSQGVSSICVSSMREGVELAAKQQFLYIGFNAANIDYKPSLSLLRHVTNDPILISTTSYTMQEQGEALRLGADLFGQISDSPNDNFTSVMALINRLNVRAKQHTAPDNLVVARNVVLSPAQRRVYVDGAEIELTKMDFDILHFFMENCGHVLSFEQIYNYAWEDRDNESVHNAVRCAVKRLRKKITEQGSEENVIETIRGFGYRFMK